MNTWLAQIYGTGGASDDIEKTAQSMLLEKMAAAEGIDISGLTPEQVSALAAEVIPTEGQETQQTQQIQQNQGQQVQQPQGQQGMIAQAGGAAPSEETVDEPSEELAKEAAAKFEEADFLGRVMAHSYTQELEKIAEKRKTAGFGDAARRFGGAVAGHAGAAAEKGKEVGSKALEFGKKHKGAVGAAAGAGAAGFGAGRMSKEASVFIEKLAEIRATEILAENGIDASTGLPLQQEEEEAPVAQQTQSAVAQPQQQVQQAVDQKAVELLKQAGYTFKR